MIGEDWGATKANPAPRANTTIACIATDVDLTIDQMKRVTMMAQDGLARAIRPIHSPFDGDVVFGLSTAKQPLKGPLADYTVARIGSMAIDPANGQNLLCTTQSGVWRSTDGANSWSNTLSEFLVQHAERLSRHFCRLRSDG